MKKISVIVSMLLIMLFIFFLFIYFSIYGLRRPTAAKIITEREVSNYNYDDDENKPKNEHVFDYYDYSEGGMHIYSFLNSV